MSTLTRRCFYDEEAAYKYIESKLWPKGPVCPHCEETKRVNKMKGKATRIGLYKCYACRKQFTVKIGTIFESSHVKMHLWLQAIHLVASSKKGISANQLHRTLGVTLKTAWFMGHRIREAMRSADTGEQLGSGGGTVEADETFIGHQAIKPSKHRGHAHKQKVLSLLDRNTKRTRSIVVDDLRAGTIQPLLKAHIAKEAKLMTDEAQHYAFAGKHFADHRTVMHTADEYVFAFDKSIHTNTIEGFFSIFKRGMKGVYQHCRHHHLHRYLHEFDFRYAFRVANGVEDEQRADILLNGVKGRRLTYQTVSEGDAAPQ
ncbi:MAG: IS1595 family transposase [Gammaproteobacteria bacterium]|nr:IS1595 family transposase [Gammaproteobacteria bacterium]